MGQIVFLYFIQKKGWLGCQKPRVGSGPHDFLRTLARGDCVRYGNFFNDVLEPLSTTLGNGSRHEAWCNRFKSRIPSSMEASFEPLGD